MYVEILAAVIIGYLLGSIPFALVIGRVFYKTDIRNYGSKNLGGSNAGRVLGKKAGVAVMVMDILKVTFAIFITSHFQYSDMATVLSGLAAAAGHCYPIFAGFKGGKAVAVMYGFLFGMGVFGPHSIWIFFFPLIVYVIILYIWKTVSLASISSAIINTIFILITEDSWLLFSASLIFTVVIIIRHKSNIIRMMNHEENKIKWM